MRMNREFVKKVIPDVNFQGTEFPADVSFSIDSRTLAAGEIFVALKGSSVDGHDYISDALKRGASGLLVSASRIDVLKKIDVSKLAVAVVSDTYAALIELATQWRSQFSIPIIGITGSVGKTSTKEMLAMTLELAGKNIIASQGNQNTVLGNAINVLKLRQHHEVAIFEMGINRRGEMARMAAVIRPTMAIITTIGHSHMEGLGSLNDIAAEKRDIFKYFKEDNIGIINGDLPFLATIAYTHPVIKFGTKMTNQVQARKIQTSGSETHFTLKLYRERCKLTMPSCHLGPVMNSLSVAAVGYILNIPTQVLLKGICSPVAVKGRFEQKILKNNRGILIDDCYNASPESMKAALLAFEKLETKGKKIVVLADMLELGVNSPFWHRQIGRFLRKVPSVEHVILVGENIKWAKKTMPIFMSCDTVLDWKGAVECVNKLSGESAVLVKGSNSMGLSKLVSELAE